MSDLFYSETVSENKYEKAILSFIPLLQYSVAVRRADPFGYLYEAAPPSATPQLKTRFPRVYMDHLRRFLWRYYLFSGLYSQFHLSRKQLSHKGTSFLESMLVMMDTILEQLVVRCLRLGESLTTDTRFPYFDDYLVTEFVVGQHDPESVDAWRMDPAHVNHDLERINPEALGKPRRHINRLV